MARAIPKREWLEVEEDLCRTAMLEYLMEQQWLWERPLPGGHSPLTSVHVDASDSDDETSRKKPASIAQERICLSMKVESLFIIP